jgi:predicted amidophosphoribosyltransferase
MTRYCSKCDRMVQVIEQLLEIVCADCGEPLRDGGPEFEDGDDEPDFTDDETVRF